MTFKRPAYEEVTIAQGGFTLTLRPSLRAVTTLEEKFGLAAISRGLAELNLSIIREIILTCSANPQDGAAFLSSFAGKPLSPFFSANIEPLCDLVRMFLPAPSRKPTTGESKSGEAMPIATMLATLFDLATGWLRWTPAQAWESTPTEISRAYAAHIEQLKAIHGSGDEDNQQQAPDAYTSERLKQIDEQGFDPAFDRNGLSKLKANIAGGRQ